MSAPEPDEPLGDHDELTEVALPDVGVWRVGPATDPYETRPALTADELNSPSVGNRFDSPLGDYTVLYFGTTLEACFGETLSRYRPDPTIAALVQGEWSSQGFMNPGEVPADWRHARLAVRASVRDGLFLDVESLTSRQTLARRLAPLLAIYGATDLDVSVIRSGDRRITRAVSYWAWLQLDEAGGPRYAGLRYLSRLNSNWECWAIFDRASSVELERRAIAREMPELEAVANAFSLRVY